MIRLFLWMKQETSKAIPAIVYFAVTFNLLHVSQILNHSPGERWLTGYFGATIGALIAGKVVILTNNAPFINCFRGKPLCFTIIWKFFIYSIVVILVQLADIFVRNVYHVDLITGMNEVWIFFLLPRFWAVQIWLLFLFLVYITVNELCSMVGRQTLRKVLFGL